MLDEFIDEYRFFIKTGNGPHERMAVEATAPTSAVNEQGERELVATELRPAEAGMVEPENSAAPVGIGAAASDTLDFKRSGVKVELVGASDSSRTVEEDKAIYPEALVDTDYTVGAMSDGAETYLHVRSEDAPEEARFRFDLPAGAQLHLTRNAIGTGRNAPVGAEVVKDGKVVQSVAPPAAADADGQPVPVRYAIEGNELILKIDHRSGDFLYPLLVDPYFRELFGNTGLSNFGYYEDDWQFDGYDCVWNPNCGTGIGTMNGTGLYVSGRAGHYENFRNGGFWFQAPRGAQIPRADFNWEIWSANSCVFGTIQDPTWARNEGPPMVLCPGWTAHQRGYHAQCTDPSCGTGGSEPGNYARFGLIQTGGTYWTTWAFTKAGYVFMWEPWPPSIRWLAPADGHQHQWDGNNRRTRWLREGEVFRYRYNVWDDGLGLDWVDENNFGRTINGQPATRSASTGACDWPSYSCPYEYMVPENSATWEGNETAGFAEGVTRNWARAFDNVGHQSGHYDWYIRVDKSDPTISWGGPLGAADNQTFEVSEIPSLDLNITARDGDPSHPSLQRSGVSVLDIELVGRNDAGDWTEVKRLVRKSRDPGCESNCQVDSTFRYEPNVDGVGTYKLRVTATDAVGHSRTEVRTVTFKREKLNVTLQHDGAFASGDFGGSSESNLDLAKQDLGVGGVRVFAQWSEMTRLESGHPDYDDAHPELNPAKCTPPALPPDELKKAEHYNFDRLERVIDNATARGLSVTLALDGHVPCWAIAREDDRGACATRQSDCSHQPNLEYYEYWITAIREKVGAQVSRWSPWNEPNLVSHLEPQQRRDPVTQEITNPRSGAQHYRSMFLRAKSIVGTPAFMFGDVAFSRQAANDEGGTDPVDFLKIAACAGYACPSDSPGVIDATEIAYHDYVGANRISGAGTSTPTDNRTNTARIAQALRDLQNHSPSVLSSALRWVAHTEGGVRIDGNLISPTQQAAYLNCMEETAWRERTNTRFAQYLLQNPPHGSPGQGTFSGLRDSANFGETGTKRPAYDAFRAPLTVRRTSSGIRVWGAWRPSPLPPNNELTLHASGGGTSKSRIIRLNGHYFDEELPSSWIAPGAAWYFSAGSATSRVANEGDCG